ncbi:MAG: SPOR domain-containing protein [Bacteroidetes bacterium]|nr:SPOR domain-containing protein [Bacteroidota bacterium]
MKFQILFILSLLCSISSMAQMQRDTLTNGIVVVKDIRYDLLSDKKAEINKKALLARTPVKGFRLQIMNTTDRAEALNAKSKMLTLYPEQKLYLSYQAPYFKLRMGNFREYSEASDFKKRINELFPKGITIVPANIEYKAEVVE